MYVGMRLQDHMMRRPQLMYNYVPLYFSDYIVQTITIQQLLPIQNVSNPHYNS